MANFFAARAWRWRWNLKRKGAEDCIVQLIQYQKVEYADAERLLDGFLPDRDYTHAPYLNRVAVVSAPVVDEEDKPIAGRLNENVSQALKDAKAIAERKGFVPDRNDFAHLGEGQSAGFIKAYDEYMS